MKKVDLKISCGDLGIFDDHSCPFDFYFRGVEDGNNVAAYEIFKVLANSHYVQHKDAISEQEFNKRIDSGLQEFSSRLEQKGEITKNY
jgi:hypothetical protein